MASASSALDNRSISDLTVALFGESLTLDEVFARVPFEDRTSGSRPPEPLVTSALWVGSAGYERHKDSAVFAERLRDRGVECLIDVRELPISRRRGYAKTALSEALERHGVQYVHMRALGNPKPYRDMYKAGRVEEGRRAYRQLLVSERLGAVEEIVPLLREKRCALMCVEHEEDTCHRSVILDALQNELGLSLAIAQVA
jgi:uncharacterized protein (DUF488 family)